ncbi:MerR family transcriptional regulator [Sediminibacillus halophilus]|uniref:DNA-binding transcriptional regulator, MerR family n=1 Tax=Sediminibacillus halophilus TaxID=482461 RepID=A0A1G9W5F6_9BACI|nr:MerR family transcriptional regulator [Sediminibacillus halophilus]SDM79739.1 DNA-binding transcriptional regulator, MerR family [Sediminibacillus halophilus]
MQKQISIGDVARLFKLKPSTLRYYDQIGLFQPNYTDPETQYRYYTINQFVVLDTIIFLRKNGFSLKDIKQHLDMRTPENTLEILKRKYEEVQQEARRLERISNKIENKITLIEEGLDLYSERQLTYRYIPKRTISYLYNDKPIDLLEVDEELYLKDLELSASSTLEYDGFFSGDLGAVVDKESLKKEGPVKYHAVFELVSDEKEGEKTGLLTEGYYACYPYWGSYESIKEGYEFVLNKIKEDGYQVNGSPIEIALLDESVIMNPDDYVTLIELPVKKC